MKQPINLKMATAVAAVLTLVASLALQAAYAQGGASGRSNFLDDDKKHQARINFDLNTSISDTNPKDDIGVFPGAIKNFTDDGGTVFEPLSFRSAELTVSRLPGNPKTFKDNFPGLDIQGKRTLKCSWFYRQSGRVVGGMGEKSSLMSMSDSDNAFRHDRACAT